MTSYNFSGESLEVDNRELFAAKEGDKIQAAVVFYRQVEAVSIQGCACEIGRRS